MNVKRLPSEWEVITNIKILDPDGWDRKNFASDWLIPLTEEEFYIKAMSSTINPMYPW